MQQRQTVIGLLVLLTTCTLLVLNSIHYSRVDAIKPQAPPHPERVEEEDRRWREQGQEGRDQVGIVTLNFMGRLGNNLFEYAAARVLSDRLGWPLALQADAGNKAKFSTLLRPEGQKCFPGVRPLGPSLPIAEIENLEIVNFASMEQESKNTTARNIWMRQWYQNFGLFSDDKDHIRKVMALDPSCCGSTSPGLNDLVIHYRNYKAELTDVQYDKLIFKDLGHEYYAMVLEDSENDPQGRPNTVFVVGEFEEDHPLIVKLREHHDNVQIAKSVDNQFHAFCFLSRAPRLVMAESTFSWWAAFLGEASIVHFPLSNGGVTKASIAVKGDPRYVYRNNFGLVVPAPAR